MVSAGTSTSTRIPLYRSLTQQHVSIPRISLGVPRFPKSITYVPRLLLTVSPFSDQRALVADLWVQWTSADVAHNVFAVPSAIFVPRVVLAFIRSCLEELVVTSIFFTRLTLPVSTARATSRLLCSLRRAQMPSVQDAPAASAVILTPREFGATLMLLLTLIGGRWNKTVCIPIRKAICFPARLMITVSVLWLLLLLGD